MSHFLIQMNLVVKVAIQLHLLLNVILRTASNSIF